MADERIGFEVTDGGTTDVFIQLLDKLGITGEQAYARLEAALPNYANKAAAAAKQQELLNTFLLAGGTAAQECADHLALLTEVELDVAVSSRAFITGLQDIGVAEQVIAQRAVEAADKIAAAEAEKVAATERSIESFRAAAAETKAQLATLSEAWALNSQFTVNQARNEAYSIQAAYDNIAASCATVAKAMSSAAAQGAAAMREQVDSIIANGGKITEFYAAEEAAYAENARMMIDIAHDEAAGINAAMDTVAKNASVANNLRFLAALEAEKSIAGALAEESEAWTGFGARVTQVVSEIKASVASMVETTVAASAETASKLGTAFGGITKYLSGAVAQITAFVGATAAIKDIDALGRINNQLLTMTGSTKAAADVFTRLAAVADNSQQPLESVVNTFTQLDAVARKQGESTDVAVAATANLTRILAAAGVTGAQAGRLLHDFSEELATGGAAGQALTAALRNNAAAVDVFSRVLNVDITSLRVHKDGVNEAKVAYEQAKLALSNYTDGTTNAAGQLRQIDNSQKDANTSLEKLDNTLKGHIGSVAQYKNDLITQRTESDKASDSNGKYGASYATLSAVVDTQRKAETELLQERVASTGATLKQQEDLRKAFTLSNLAAASTSDAFKSLPPAAQTISGALTTLNNRLIEYIQTSGQATNIINEFGRATDIIGQNLPVVVPTVIALGAAFAAVKVGTLVGDIASFTFNLGKLIILNPEIAALGVILAIIIALVSKTDWGKEKIQQAVDAYKGWINSVNESVSKEKEARQAAVDNATAIGNLAKAKRDDVAASAAQASADRSTFLGTTQIIEVSKEHQRAVDDVGDAYKKQDAAATQNAQSMGGVIDAARRAGSQYLDFSHVVDGANSSVGNFGQGLGRVQSVSEASGGTIDRLTLAQTKLIESLQRAGVPAAQLGDDINILRKANQDASTAFNTNATSVESSANAVKAAQDNLNSSVTKVNGSLSNVQGWNDLTDAQKQFLAYEDSTGQVAWSTIIRNVTTLAEQNKAAAGNTDTLNTSTQTLNGTIGGINDSINTVNGNIPKIADTTKSTTDTATSDWGALGKAIAPALQSGLDAAKSALDSWLAAWKAGIQQAIDDLDAAKRAVPAGGGGGGTDTPDLATGGSRDGSSFTVAGGTGVDSKLIAVSPGEHVTVQTPMQAMLGVVNHATPLKFRDGGMMDLTGIKADFTSALTATNQAASVTGFQSVQDTAYYTNGKMPTPVSVKSSATPTPVTTTTPDPVTTTTTSVGRPLPSGSLAGSNTSTTTAPATTTSHFDTAGYEAAKAAYAQKRADIEKNLLPIGGISVPTDVHGIGWSNDQRHAYALENGVIVINPGATFTTNLGGGVNGYALEGQAITDAAGPAPNPSDYIKARDGLDLHVAGGSGVDSRLVQLAVSPGESIAVRTPTQRQAAADADDQPSGRGRGSRPINVTFQVPDANSYNRSKSQITSDMKRALQKVN